jgi:hypothetical protein
MELWGWILVYLVGFTLLQLVLFRYFGDGASASGASVSPDEASPPRSAEGHNAVADTGPEATGSDDADGVSCRQCGTRNADGYTYCRECLGQLH